MFPLGRLREPSKSLARASAIVVTRVEAEQDIAGLRQCIRKFNPEAPIYISRIAPRAWVDYASNAATPVAEVKLAHVAAFCGLGNPRAFWQTLEELEIQVAFRWAFSDHHHYSCTEVERLAAQAKMHGSNLLLTTEKDAMNLPDSTAAVLEQAGVEVYWLKIGVQVEKEEELLELIVKASECCRSSTRLHSGPTDSR